MSPEDLDQLFLERLADLPRGVTVIDRIDRSGDCWIWTGAKTGTGHGQFHLNGKHYYAHRLALELTRGIGEGLFACHNCPGGDNPSCCRPSHLFIGTHRENMRDAVNKGRIRHGSAHGNAKLSEVQVAEIRSALTSGVRGADLARRYNVSPQLIYDIRKGRGWLHVPPANDNARRAG